MSSLFGDEDDLAPARAEKPSRRTSALAAGPVVRVPVLLPVALDHVYDYGLPPGLEVEPGAFVIVPFGPQERIGIVWDRLPGGPDDDAEPVPDKKIKPILHRLDVPPLPVLSLRFAEWVARYTLNPRGMVARMMMSASEAFEAPKLRFGVRMVGSPPPRMTPARERIVQIASDGLIRTKAQLAHEASATTAVVDGLVAAGTLVQVELPEKRLPQPNPDHAVVEFNEQQTQAVHALQSAIDGNVFSVSLLDGVTGSGKTEVYFEAVARALARDPECQILVMLPEIALTGQFIERFERRFGVKPVEWHSAVSPTDRGRIWKAAATGEARVIAGARSALFLPFAKLGLIVVDEEHDPGFKQEDRVFYQGRDMAVVRGNLGGIPVILASATPSIESHWNARAGRYRHVHLAHRFSGSEMPDVKPIDLRKAPPEKGKWLSPVLVDAVTEAIGRGEQALLFLNRRGYAPMTLCRGCGHRFDCPQCTAWLVEHRFRHRLICHHCGFSLPIPEGCPKCGEIGALVPCGPGIERIAEEVTERWPDARQALLSSDLIPGITELREVLRQIQDGESQIIVGTQIVAKGHNFSKLQLVGVVDGDLGLAGSDPRAGERTFQLLHQVTGRAGRVMGGGRGFVQTHNPDHPVMEAIIAGDRELFIEREIASRQMGMLPPFGRLASLVVSAREKEIAEGYARQVARSAPEARRIEVLGPAEAPIAVVRGRYRFRLLVKAPREIDIQSYLRAWLEQVPKIKGDIRLTVDVDPYNFL